MAVVPPRQVAVLSIANYHEVLKAGGPEAGAEALDALKQMANFCGVDSGCMRKLRQDTLLLRLDAFPQEEFLSAIRCMTKHTRDIQAPGLEGLTLSVRVGAMSERAMRSIVDDTAIELLSYMDHAGCDAAFLAADDLDQWISLKGDGVEFIAHEQLKGIDPFTGLINENRYLELLQDAIDNRELYGSDMAALFFDIDDFKSYNRSYSHADGNELLLFVADKISEVFAGDIVCHLSIDRFAVLTNSPDIAARCATIHKETRAFNRSFAPEIKCGIFKLDETATSAYVALDCAKLACESIKGRYDSAYQAFGESLKERFFTRRYVARHAEQAVAEGWILAYAQPIIDTDSGQLCGFEALARWNDPERGLLSPAVFIPTLEDAHLINKLDLYMVDAVCRHLAERREQGLPVVPASVNLSRLDFGLCDIAAEVTRICDRWDIPHELLAVEITESALQSGATLQRDMDRFRAAGFEVWMDDFGCGYSSLNLLKDYDFDVLKVDMEFLRDMETNERSKTIVISVLEMARSLGVRTLVEGVENTVHRDFLREAGCDMMQGYLFGKPGPIEFAEV